jgi:putative tricarboxylic transport membrane protein
MLGERGRDLVVSIIVLAISILFYFNTKTLAAPADIFPKVVIGFFFGLGTLLLLKTIFFKKYGKETEDEKESEEAVDQKRRWVSIVCLLAYIIIFPIVGFYVTSAIFLTLISVYLRGEKQGFIGYLKPFMISCIVMVILYGTFNVFLKVPIPTGLLI